MGLEWVSDFQFTHSGDGLAQPDKLLAIQLIGVSEVVDDASSGLVSLRMSHVVSQLVIGDDETILVLSFCRSQVHAYYYSIYYKLCQ